MKVYKPDSKKENILHKVKNSVCAFAKKIKSFFASKKIDNSNNKFTELEKDYIETFRKKNKYESVEQDNFEIKIENNFNELKQEIAYIKNILIKLSKDNKRKYCDNYEHKIQKDNFKKTKSL